jgi:hypothetical protein
MPDANNYKSIVSLSSAEWRAFFCFDITDFTDYESKEQLQIIESLIKIFQGSKFQNECRERYERIILPEAQLCIGDGYIFVFKDVLSAVWYAACLAAHVEHASVEKELFPFFFRGGVHWGQVYSFFDPGRKAQNYIGDGINGATRIYEVIGKEIDNIIFISHETRQQLLEAAHKSTELNDDWNSAEEMLQFLLNKGRRRDKHKIMWRVYELDHMKAYDEWTRQKDAPVDARS